MTNSWVIVIICTAFGGYYLGSYATPKPSTASTTPLAATVPPKHNISKSNLEAAWADFVEVVGKENVSTLESDLEHHAGSDWSTHNHQESERPFLVVYPASTEEVSGI